MKSNHPFAWPKLLLDLCWIIEIARGEETIAYIWFNPVVDGVIECHACALPEWRGRWLTRTVVHTVADTITKHTGCRAMIARVTSPLVERIWRALGFDIHGKIAIWKVKESDSGRLLQDVI